MQNLGEWYITSIDLTAMGDWQEKGFRYLCPVCIGYEQTM